MKKANVIITVLLSVIMALSVVPTNGYADEETGEGGCIINSTNFPDANFRNYVSSQFDTDSNGMLSEEEIKDVVTINVGEKNISSLEGICYFVNVQEIFCYKNALTSIDVSANTALEKLHCYSNELRQLNISKNTNLKYLNCHTNYLIELNLRNNKELLELDCDRNEINELDVSENTNLRVLSCGRNGLQQLDVHNNQALVQLFCDGNQLTSLDISGNPDIEYCNCAENQYDVEVDENNQIDLSRLPGEMDVEKTDGWVNAIIDGNILTVKKGVDTVTYNYDIGKGQKEQFTLHISNNTEEVTEETVPQTEKETSQNQMDEMITGEPETSGRQNTTSNQSKVFQIKKPVVKKVSGVKIKSSKKKLTLVWKKNTSVSGYQIRISTNKKFSKAKIKKVKKKKNKYVFRKLKRKKRYYIQIRAYVTYKNDMGKTQIVCGKWVTKKKKTK